MRTTNVDRLTRWSRAAGSRFVWIILSSALLFGAIPYCLNRLGWTTSLSDGIYIGTGIAVLWYTLEMVHANKIAVLPLVVARIETVARPGGGGPNYIESVVLRNIGRSAAVFVQVADFDAEPIGQGRFVNRIEGTDVIEAGAQVAVDSFGYYVGDDGQIQRADNGNIQRTSDTLTSFLKPTASKPQQVNISYEDVAGGKHKSVMGMGKGGIRLLSHR